MYENLARWNCESSSKFKLVSLSGWGDCGGKNQPYGLRNAGSQIDSFPVTERQHPACLTESLVVSRSLPLQINHGWQIPRQWRPLLAKRWASLQFLRLFLASSRSVSLIDTLLTPSLPRSNCAKNHHRNPCHKRFRIQHYLRERCQRSAHRLLRRIHHPHILRSQRYSWARSQENHRDGAYRQGVEGARISGVCSRSVGFCGGDEGIAQGELCNLPRGKANLFRAGGWTVGVDVGIVESRLTTHWGRLGRRKQARWTRAAWHRRSCCNSSRSCSRLQQANLTRALEDSSGHSCSELGRRFSV